MCSFQPPVRTTILNFVLIFLLLCVVFWDLLTQLINVHKLHLVWLPIALVHLFCYCTKFSCMNRPQFVYTFTFWEGIWVVSIVLSYKQCCHDQSSTDFLGTSACVSLQHAAGVESLGQGIGEYPTLYKIIPDCVPVYTPTRLICKILHPLQHSVSSGSHILANQRVTRWQLIVILIYISVTIHEIEYLLCLYWPYCYAFSVISAHVFGWILLLILVIEILLCHISFDFCTVWPLLFTFTSDIIFFKIWFLTTTSSATQVILSSGQNHFWCLKVTEVSWWPPPSLLWTEQTSLRNFSTSSPPHHDTARSNTSTILGSPLQASAKWT